MIANAYNMETLDEQNEQELFLKILYHDRRNGNMIRAMFPTKKGQKIRHFATKDISKLYTQSVNASCYTTVNTFKGCRRKAEQVYNYSAIFIDLDCHEKSTVLIDEAIEKTIKRLNMAFDNDEVSIPTMITNTGRGLGIYYVLDKSIANTKNSIKMIKHYKTISSLLREKYSNLLAEDGYLKVDKTVSDASRICRLPLTLNFNINRFCRLIHVEYTEEDEVRYYSLKELLNNNDLFSRTQKLRKQIVKKKIIGIDEYKLPFLMLRLENLSLLQQLRGYDCRGYREYMVFIYYNAAKQIYSETYAKQITKDFNSKFIYPLSENELNNIFSGIDKNVAPITKDYEGFYKISDEWISKNLEITEEEQKTVGFFGSKRKIERQIKKEQTKIKKNTRDQEIIDYVIEHPELTYEDISSKFSVSKSTVFNICKKNKIHRYKKEQVDSSEADIEVPILKISPQLNRIQRNETIAEYIKANPRKTASQVASVFDVKKSLIYNIMYDYKLELSTKKFKSKLKNENNQNLKKMSESIYVVHKEHGPAPSLQPVLDKYTDLYRSITQRRRANKQVPGQIGFKFTDQGVEYYSFQ